jgi:hypothetical protein
MSEPIEVALPDGTVVWARVSGAEHLDEDRPSAVGAGRRAAAKIQGLTETITGVAASVRAATAELGPDEVAVHFGVELSVSPGALVAVLADGEARTSLTVVLGWHRGRSGEDPAAGGDEAAGTAG